MQLVGILTAAFLLSSCSFVLGNVYPQGYYRLTEWALTPCTRSCGGGTISRRRSCLDSSGNPVLMRYCITLQFMLLMRYMDMSPKNSIYQLQPYQEIQTARCNVQRCPERKSLEDLFKYGTWKRYRTDGEEELFKFLGYEQYYDYLKNLDVFITMEKTEDGIIETYTRGAHDVITTISGENLDKYTIDFGDGTPFEVNTEEDIDDDLIITFEKDGITRIHEREYQGENEFIATLTLKRGDETFVAVDYFRKVPKVEDLFKIGTWKRYKTDGEEELFKFLGAEQYYDHVKKLDVYIKMEKTENGIVQIYTRGLHKIVTTITGEKLDQATIDDGNGDPFQFNTVEAIDDDLIITFEKDGITHIQEREYQGENEFVQKVTLKRGDETCVTVDYFRKVPEGLDYTKLIGLWKRYRVDEEEELYRFFGAEEYYHLLKDLEVYIKIEKTDEGFLETYTSGATKVVTTITGENNDQVTIDFGDGKPIQFGPDNNGTFEKDGILRTHRRELHGTHYFISTNTFKKGDKTHVTVDYFRKVE